DTGSARGRCPRKHRTFTQRRGATVNSLRVHNGSTTFLRHAAGSGCVVRLLVIASQAPNHSAGGSCVPCMALAPDQGPSATASAVSVNPVGIWRLLAVAAPHLAALGVMLHTETDLGSRTGFLLSWGILNFFWIALLRRPALSGALSLTLVVVLVLLSRLKHDVVQMTANFVDLMVIDRDTAAFLFTIFPNLRWSVLSAGLVTI